jgi:Protein of unknown function (DUF2637)
MVTQNHQPATTHRTAIVIAAAIVAPLLCGLAVLGGIGSFTTIRNLAEPWFGHLAWIIPVGTDLGILALLAWDLLAEYLTLSWPVLRWTAWAFIAATVYLNIAAAHGNPVAAVMHAAMPDLFITVIEGIRHLIRQLTGLATGTRIEHIPLSRWLLAPRSTLALGRRMVLWHVTSYRDGLRLEYEHLAAVSRLQQQYGHWQWRWRAPLQDRLALRLPPVAAAAEPSKPKTVTSEQDRELVAVAADILRNAREHGIYLSQIELARQLRARGLSIANQRLHWLTTAVTSG